MCQRHGPESDRSSHRDDNIRMRMIAHSIILSRILLCGAVAQLIERRIRIAEVRGLNPLSSTTYNILSTAFTGSSCLSEIR